MGVSLLQYTLIERTYINDDDFTFMHKLVANYISMGVGNKFHKIISHMGN